LEYRSTKNIGEFMSRVFFKRVLHSLGYDITKITKEALESKKKYNQYNTLFEKYSNYTMIPQTTFIKNLELCEIITSGEGAVVECGVWRGGMIAAISELLGSNSKEYHLFDSFEGLPLAKDIDGKEAIEWQNNKESPFYYDNCKAEKDLAEQAMRLAKCVNFQIHKGWFDNNMRNIIFKNGIDILRLDADWYESVMICLENLFPKINIGGALLIDDYYTWEGCSKAVHDYLSKYKLPYRIKQYDKLLAYIIKDE